MISGWPTISLLIEEPRATFRPGAGFVVAPFAFGFGPGPGLWLGLRVELEPELPPSSCLCLHLRL